MNSVAARKWEYKGIRLIGNSTAGVGTSFTCPEVGAVFDVAQGLPHAYTQPNYLVTHGHMDHAGGIPYIVSQRALMGLPPANFYLPETAIEPMDSILKTWSNMEGHEYKYHLRTPELGKFYPLKNKFSFQIFPTVHRVPSHGYCVFERNKKLKAKFRGATGEEIRKAKLRGEEIEENIESPILAFTGDTQIEFLDQCDWVKKARTLVVEVTYIDAKKTIDQAKEWGHIHFDEIKERFGELECEKIVFIHLSARHKSSQFQEVIRKSLSKSEQERIVVFPRDGL